MFSGADMGKMLEEGLRRDVAISKSARLAVLQELTVLVRQGLTNEWTMKEFAQHYFEQMGLPALKEVLQELKHE